MTLSQPQPDMPGIAGGQALSQAQTQFFIPATASLHERRPRTLKYGNSFAVFDHSGDAISGPGSPEGCITAIPDTFPTSILPSTPCSRSC